MTDIDEFDDDEMEDEPLPVVTPDGVPVEKPKTVASSNRRRRLARSGNVKADAAPMARQDAIKEATGRGPKRTDEWREELAQGERGRAVAALSRRGMTHNADRGFGLS